MHPYVWIPLVACVGSALTAGLILSRDSASPANRRLALLSACTAFWAMCEVAWNNTDDRASAQALVRLSALGWIWLGPVCMDVFVTAAESHRGWTRPAIRIGYGLSAVFLVLVWTTDWIHRDVVHTSWGWGYTFGPLFPAYYALTAGGVALGYVAAVRAWRRLASPAERSQGLVVAAAITVPLTAGTLTDGLLPMLGVQLPRLGTAGLTLMGFTVAWSYFHFGYSLLAPGRFAPEILESLADGVMLVRPGGRVRIVNRGMARLLGCSPAEARELSLPTLLPFVPLEPPREVDDLEGDLVLPSGPRIPVSVSSSLLRDKRGLPIGIVLVVHDLREMVALRQRLVTSGRLAAVGQLAAGIAHEINNPIAYVRANLGLLHDHWQQLAKALEGEGPSPSAETAERIEEGFDLIAESQEGVDRAAAIVRDVKGFSHAGGEGRRERAELGPLLERALRIAEPQLRGRARIERAVGETPAVPCAPQEIQQVFLNLVLNAGQAVEAGGRVVISTGVEEDAVLVAVEDDGPGIDPAVMERIFDPFFTTKAVGEGTGLGLAISYQIVRSHGGEIRVASEPGRGSRFEVRLPRH